MDDDAWKLLEIEFGKIVRTSKQLAAIRQIEAAIEHFENDEYECAITLAAAAEGLIPDTAHPHIFSLLRARPKKELDYNLLINWLKHPIEPEEILLPEFEAAIIIMRAISKLIAVYNTGTVKMQKFGRWVFERGHLPIPKNWE